MGKISMVMFDLSGTTVYDDTGVRDCLFQAAQEYNLKTTPEEILYNMGTNKIHLYQFLIARQMGKKIDIEDFEKIKDPETYEQAVQEGWTQIEYFPQGCAENFLGLCPACRRQAEQQQTRLREAFQSLEPQGGDACPT